MHPLLPLLTTQTLITLTLSFTPPTSPLRPLCLLPLTLCVALCIPQCMPHMIRTPWAALVGGYAVTYLYHYIDVALLSCWSFEDGGVPVGGLLRPTASRPDNDKDRIEYRRKGVDSVLERLKFGVRVTASFRFVGTRYEVRNTPSAGITQRGEFLRWTFGKVLVSYCVLDLVSASNDPAISSRFLTKEKVPVFVRFDEVTAEELTIRFFTVLAAGVSLNCVQGGIYHVCALLAVKVGVSEPAEWPPFYGDVREAYGLRRFWDIFWHQTNFRKFSSIAHYVTHVVLGLRRGTTTARYIRVLVAFASSGVMHLVDDVAAGVSLRDSGAMRFFLVQALGMIVEDCVVRMYHRIQPKSNRVLETAVKAIGFVWVAVFLTWSVPAYMYPMLWRANLGLNDSTIPFSFFAPGVERLKAFGCFVTLGIVSLVG